MIELVAGANSAIPAGVVILSVSGPLDLSALVTGPDGKVAADADFVFYNQPNAPGVRLGPGTVTIDPARLRRGASRVVVVASAADMTTPLGRLPPPTLTVRGAADRVLARFRPSGLTTETVVQLGEIYRRDSGWKLRAIGQGYANGLAGLAQDFGVEVDDDGTRAEDVLLAPVAAAPVAAAPVAVAVVAEVVALTNAQRDRRGLVQLSGDTRLARAAQAHTEDMIARRFFAHDSPDGRSVADRVTAAGYAYSVVAENIAAGQRTASEVVAGWMDSPGHRANILNPDVRQIGVGFSVGGELGSMWTQVFGTPR